MNTRLAAATAVLFMLAVNALAQCPPQRLTSPTDFAGDYGVFLAMNDRHLIVADPRDHSLCGDPFCANGYAYAYQKDAGGSWVLRQTIAPADLSSSFGFGAAVALDGDRAIITALLGQGCGTVGTPYIFEFDGEAWVEVDRLCPPDGRGIHGERLALHGDMALVGKAGEDVLVYHRSAGGWEITHDLSSPDSPSDRSDFGWAFDLDDDWVVIGAQVERSTATFGGAVYIYRRIGSGELELAQKLIAPDIAAGPQFGSSVAIDSHTLAISGHISDRAFEEQGAVYMFELFNGAWTLQQEIMHADPELRDRFGTSLALEGDLLVVGAASDRTPTSLGAAYLFQRGSDGRWQQAAELFPHEPASDFGQVVAMADGMAAIGAYDTYVGGDIRGSVDIFDLSCYLCPPDLDADGALTIFDFLTFFNLFQDGDAQADFDGDGELTLFDFLAFQTAFDAGCA